MSGRNGSPGEHLNADARAEVYFTLSECFKEPGPAFADEAASGILKDHLTSVFATLGIASALHPLHQAGEAGCARLQRSYHRLFTVPSSSFVLPVESVFKEWRAGDRLGPGMGMIMGPPAQDMARRYHDQGLEPPLEFRTHPDHVALLLEYGGLLCQEGNGDELQEFVASHLDGWIETFVEQVDHRSEHDFYRTVGQALLAFVQAERRRLGLSEPERPALPLRSPA